MLYQFNSIIYLLHKKPNLYTNLVLLHSIINYNQLCLHQKKNTKESL